LAPRPTETLVTRLMIERFDAPGTARDARVRAWFGDHAGDELAGRTVWCAAALPGGRASAQALRTRLRGPGAVVAADGLDVTANEPLHRLAQQLEQMLVGADAAARLGPAEDKLCADGAGGAERLIGGGVGPDDVVVVHDALTALLAEAVRARGAHTVWHVHLGTGSRGGAARRALSFLHRYTTPVDAYIMTSSAPGPRGRIVERVAAVMPAADVLAATEMPAPAARADQDRLAWSTVLADIVQADRDEHVGGTRGVRPAVAAR
jgi:hypothetical protein